MKGRLPLFRRAWTAQVGAVNGFASMICPMIPQYENGDFRRQGLVSAVNGQHCVQLVGAGHAERYAMQAGSTWRALSEFYHALKPHMEEIIKYLTNFGRGPISLRGPLPGKLIRTPVRIDAALPLPAMQTKMQRRSEGFDRLMSLHHKDEDTKR